MVHPSLRAALAALALALLSLPAQAETRLLMGFETVSEIAPVTQNPAPGVLVNEHATQGRFALRMPAESSLWFEKLPRGWNGYDAVEIDVYADVAAPMSASIEIGDEEWQRKPTYWNRYNDSRPLRPGANTISIPLGGLFRGEAGSRFNDLKTPIDPGHIVRFVLGFKQPEGGGTLYLDNLRLTRARQPKGVFAFDFGPDSQSVAAGFTPVSPDSAYSDGKGWGWAPGSQPGRAWDVTFPTRLLQDSVDMGDAAFQVKLAPGRYRAVVFFEPLGYWGGEAAQFTKRWLEGRYWNAVEKASEWGKLDFIYHFQDVEPLPGEDLWRTYLQYLFHPAQLDIVLPDGRFDLRVETDGVNARRIAGLILYRANDAQAEEWTRETFLAQRDEFLSRAVELPLPKTESPAPPREVDRARGCIIFMPSLDETVYFSTEPTADQGRTAISSTAARGELRFLTVALRPLRDLGTAAVEMSELRGADGAIPGDAVSVSLVRHLPTRGLGDLMYRITPRYLVPAAEVPLAADLTRQLVLSVRVPESAAPGHYAGVLTVSPEDRRPMRIPVSLEVLPFALPEADFTTGFWGIEPNVPVQGAAYDGLQQQVFEMLRAYGMTSFTGGPAIPFSGLDESGRPRLSFAAVDAFMAAARKAGFTREFMSYGGLTIRGLSDGYEKGETGAALERRYEMPYQDIVTRVWAEVEAHAAEQNWLPFVYNMCDEPRVVEVAERQIALMRLFNRASLWLRTGGSYSVSFRDTDDPVERCEQEIFRTLDVSVLNRHDQSVMDKARELGKDVYIYNQGKDRYSFGLYQWSERAKGVRGRYEWISFVRHGYEYFDLDGREPDPSAIYFSSEGLRPGLVLLHAAEGMNDFRYLQALEEALSAARPKTEDAQRTVAEARAFLSGITDRIALGERHKPDWLDLDAVRREAATWVMRLGALAGSSASD
jgi:hypothetical protein